MNLDDAIARNSIHPSPPRVCLAGDIEKGFADAEFQLEGEVSKGFSEIDWCRLSGGHLYDSSCDFPDSLVFSTLHWQQCIIHDLIDVQVLTPTQYHFYMETQTFLAIPDEDGCITIYASSQGPELLQRTVAMCLNLPIHNVRVITRRLGGGFGGKALRNGIVRSWMPSHLHHCLQISVLVWILQSSEETSNYV